MGRPFPAKGDLPVRPYISAADITFYTQLKTAITYTTFCFQVTVCKNIEKIKSEECMTKEELLDEFQNMVGEFLSKHKDELKQDVRWEAMSGGEMVFGSADISSNDFVLALLKGFSSGGARIIDSGVWQPFPNFAYPISPTQQKIYAEETVDWNVELGGS